MQSPLEPKYAENTKPETLALSEIACKHPRAFLIGWAVITLVFALSTLHYRGCLLIPSLGILVAALAIRGYAHSYHVLRVIVSVCVSAGVALLTFRLLDSSSKELSGGLLFTPLYLAFPLLVLQKPRNGFLEPSVFPWHRLLGRIRFSEQMVIWTVLSLSYLSLPMEDSNGITGIGFFAQTFGHGRWGFAYVSGYKSLLIGVLLTTPCIPAGIFLLIFGPYWEAHTRGARTVLLTAFALAGLIMNLRYALDSDFAGSMFWVQAFLFLLLPAFALIGHPGLRGHKHLRRRAFGITVTVSVILAGLSLLFYLPTFEALRSIHYGWLGLSALLFIIWFVLRVAVAVIVGESTDSTTSRFSLLVATTASSTVWYVFMSLLQRLDFAHSYDQYRLMISLYHVLVLSLTFVAFAFVLFSVSALSLRACLRIAMLWILFIQACKFVTVGFTSPIGHAKVEWFVRFQLVPVIFAVALGLMILRTHCTLRAVERNSEGRFFAVPLTGRRLLTVVGLALLTNFIQIMTGFVSHRAFHALLESVWFKTFTLIRLQTITNSNVSFQDVVGGVFSGIAMLVVIHFLGSWWSRGGVVSSMPQPRKSDLNSNETSDLPDDSPANLGVSVGR